MAKTQKSNGYESSGALLAGCAVLGTGIGFAAGNVAAGSMIGVGVAFIATAILRANGKR